MSGSSTFSGSVPRAYHAYLVPLIFEAYARDMVTRLAPTPKDRILELACGTGIVTRTILEALPTGSAGNLTATDLNQAMIDVALGYVGTDPRLKFQPVDACSIPFADRSFDAIACQFGVMFFPDKLKAMREARRVLAPGGRYIFNCWSSLGDNPIPQVVHETVGAMFHENPPTFLARLPYAYHDVREIERVTRAGGFTNVSVEEVEFPCTAPTAEAAARGFVEGTPLRGELGERGVTDATAHWQRAAKALAERFGDRPCRSTMRAAVVTAS